MQTKLYLFANKWPVFWYPICNTGLVYTAVRTYVKGKPFTASH